MKWVVAGLLLFVLAVTLNLNLMVYAIYALTAILFIAKYVTQNWAEGISANRNVSKTTAEIGEQVDVGLAIENNGRFPITWMIVEDMIPPKSLAFNPPALGVKGKRISVSKFAAGEQRAIDYEMKCNRRGYYQIGPTLIETGDMFGFNRRFRVVAKPQFLMVYPKVIPLKAYDIASKRPIGEVIMTNRLFEDPTRIAGIRDYQQGDPLNRIHWRTTASTGKLQSKIYEPSSLAGATVVVDFHKDSFDPQHEPVRSELSITAAASITAVLNEMGQQVGLVSNGRDAVDRIRTDGWAGDHRTRDATKSAAAMKNESDRMRPVVVKTCKTPQQQIQIMRALARIELTDGLRLPELLIESSSQLPRDATVIVILSSINMENAIALGSLKKQGYSVVCIANCYSDEVFAQTSGPLLANGIAVAHLKDEETISSICEKAALIF